MPFYKLILYLKLILIACKDRLDIFGCNLTLFRIKFTFLNKKLS